jgi:hypothetical protein
MPLGKWIAAACAATSLAMYGEAWVCDEGSDSTHAGQQRSHGTMP